MSDRDIHAINLPERWALTYGGQLCQITNLLDADGDETDDVVEAVSAVVRISDGAWAAILVEDYAPMVRS